MFCTSCGQAVEEGRAFCTKCGAPVSRTSGQAAPETTDLSATAVRPAAGATPPAAPPQAPLQAAVPGAYGAGWQPPQGPPKKNRTGLIVGSVIAAIIVLGGAGVGLWLGLRSDGAGTTGTTVAGSGIGTVAGDGSGPTETIPGLDGSTEGPDGTAPEGEVTPEYTIAAENLLMEMDFENGRIPELAVMINDSRPDVPGPVHDELVTMRETLSSARTALDGLLVPEELVGAHGWLAQAAEHMANRIQATIDGIEAMWDSGYTSSSRPFFDMGRDERDAYEDAMEEYWEALPEGEAGD